MRARPSFVANLDSLALVLQSPLSDLAAGTELGPATNDDPGEITHLEAFVREPEVAPLASPSRRVTPGASPAGQSPVPWHGGTGRNRMQVPARAHVRASGALRARHFVVATFEPQTPLRVGDGKLARSIFRAHFTLISPARYRLSVLTKRTSRFVECADGYRDVCPATLSHRAQWTTNPAAVGDAVSGILAQVLSAARIAHARSSRIPCKASSDKLSSNNRRSLGNLEGNASVLKQERNPCPIQSP